jgi:hypothetical protein
VSLVAWFSTISVAYRLAEAHRTGKAVDRAVGGGVVKHGSNPEGPFFCEPAPEGPFSIVGSASGSGTSWWSVMISCWNGK